MCNACEGERTASPTSQGCRKQLRGGFAVSSSGKRDKVARRFDAETEESIDVEVLEAIPFDYPGSATEVVYETEEFTAVCPWSGLPDFARLAVRYTPDRLVVELKSLKYYLTSFRNVGILQEHAVNRILRDLTRLLKPRSMVVQADYRERGGLTTRVVATYDGGQAQG
jgi:7-cyano-7-deazaguanine reductase